MIIEMEHVTGTGKGFRLQDITFALPEGYIMGLVGKNGSGKTTLFDYIVNPSQRYTGNGFSKRTREVLFGVILVIFFIVPGCHYMEGRNYITAIAIMGWVVFMYPAVMLTPYLRVIEGTKENSYLAKLKYLPLDMRQVKLVRIGYLANLLKKMLLIECAEQTITSIIISEGSNVLKNICVSLLFTIVIGGILPFLVGVIIVWTGKK